MSRPGAIPGYPGTFPLVGRSFGSKRELRQRSPGPAGPPGAAARPNDRRALSGRAGATTTTACPVPAGRRDGCALGLDPGRTTLAPGSDLGVDVAGAGDHRRPARSCRRISTTRRLKSSTSRRTSLSAVIRVQPVVELGVLLAQGEGGRQEGDVLALDELLDPPVGVVLDAEVLDRLALSGQVVELAALHRLADLQVDPRRPAGRSGRRPRTDRCGRRARPRAYGFSIRGLLRSRSSDISHTSVSYSAP